MTLYFITYNIDASAGGWVGSASDANALAAQAQALPAGMAAMETSQAACATGASLELTKAYKCEEIDQAAEAFRNTFLVMTPGQVGTFLSIKEESDRWVTGTSPAQALAAFPYLAIEALVLGVSIDAVKAQFDAAWAQYSLPAAIINAVAVATKAKITAAKTYADIAAAYGGLIDKYDASPTQACLTAWNAAMQAVIDKINPPAPAPSVAPSLPSAPTSLASASVSASITT
jgi:hypothetical protein